MSELLKGLEVRDLAAENTKEISEQTDSQALNSTPPQITDDSYNMFTSSLNESYEHAKNIIKQNEQALPKTQGLTDNKETKNRGSGR